MDLKSISTMTVRFFPSRSSGMMPLLRADATTTPSTTSWLMTQLRSKSADTKIQEEIPSLSYSIDKNYPRRLSTLSTPV